MAVSTVAAPPGRPDDDLGPAPARRRRWPRRLLIGLNVFVAVCLLGAGALYGYVTYRFGQIHRITIAGLAIGPAGTASSGGSAGPPMNVLVVGSDTRTGLANGAQFGGAAVGGARSDTIMLVHLDPGAGTASLLSIPRDLYVPIPGKGTNRINSAFDTGPDLLVRTIQDDLGIPINHFVEVNFDSFRQVVTALGGVKFWYPEPVRDNDNGVNDSGLNITTPGCYNLTGDSALALVRTRHLQYQQNGRWIFEGESDLARIRRQQLFVKKVVSKAEATGVADITRLNGVVGGIVGNLTIDSGFSQAEIVKLARRYRSFNPSSLPGNTLPTTAAVIGGADVLLLDKTRAPAAIAAWQANPGSAPAAAGPSTAVAPVDPSTISVGVLNGSGRSGEARSATTALASLGFKASVSGSGAADNYGYTTPVIRYGTGDQARAAELQSALIGGAQLQADPTLTPGSLVLVTGSGYTGVTAPAGAAGATTTVAPTPTPAASDASAAKAAFPGIHGSDPPPPGSGC